MWGPFPLLKIVEAGCEASPVVVLAAVAREVVAGAAVLASAVGAALLLLSPSVSADLLSGEGISLLCRFLPGEVVAVAGPVGGGGGGSGPLGGSRSNMPVMHGLVFPV